MQDNLIKVYNTNEEVVAVFSNKNSVFDNEKRKDILTSPVVHTALNGESTLTFSMLTKSKKWCEVNDPRYEWHCNGRVYIALNTNSFSYQGDVVNVTLVEKFYQLSKNYAQIHNVDTDVEALDEHTIKILPKTSSKFKLTVNGKTFSDSQIVDSRGVIQPRGSAGYALFGIIQANTFGWKMGVCDVIVSGFDADDDFGTFNLETDMKPLLENIQAIQSLWGGVIVWDSINKIVHLRDETKNTSDFNEWKGFEVRRNKNMVDEPTIVVDNEIITKAYILGNNNLNIKAVNDGKTYIENYSYTKEVYEGYLSNANIFYTGAGSTSGQKQLLYWGKRELEKRCKPRTQTTINIIDRRTEAKFSHEVFAIGDIVKVYYYDPLKEKETSELQRIIDYQYNVWDLADAQITVGDKILNQREIYKLIYDNSVDGSSLEDWNDNINGDKVTVNLSKEMSEYYKGGIRSSFYQILEGNMTAVTNFIKETEDEFINTNALINLYSDDLGSQITLLTDYTSSKFVEVNGKIQNMETYTQASITALSNELGSRIDLKASYDYIDTELGRAINSVEAQISIVADGIDSKVDAKIRDIGINGSEVNSYMTLKPYKVAIGWGSNNLIFYPNGTAELKADDNLSVRASNSLYLQGDIFINGKSISSFIQDEVESLLRSAETDVVTSVSGGGASPVYARTKTIYYLQWR